MMIFRKATPTDFPLVLSLQQNNLLKNITPDKQQDGFLVIEYSDNQLRTIDNQIGIFVAIEDNHLSGYLIAQTIDFAAQSGLIKTMVNRFPDVIFQSQPLSGFRTFIYGPVCIDEQSRGNGVLEGLFSVMRKTLNGQYDVGVAFVSEQNPRSLHAHKDKLEMQVVDSFEFGGNKYNTLVFSV